MKYLLQSMLTVLVTVLTTVSTLGQDQDIVQPPEGFIALFNGKNLSGWTGGTIRNPEEINSLPADEAKAWFGKMNAKATKHWSVEGGVLVGDGHETHLVTKRGFADFEMWVDWKIQSDGGAVIYLRGCSQLEFWDPIRKSETKKVADKPAGQWNRMYIRMVGPFVKVVLNGELVIDDVAMSSFFDLERPVLRSGSIHLRSHGIKTHFRHLFIRELSQDESSKVLNEIAGGEDKFTSIFNGTDFEGWTGSVAGYKIVKNDIPCIVGGRGNLVTKKQYEDFIVRLQFKLPPAGNSGLAIRLPDPKSSIAKTGLEIQVLDNSSHKYENLKPYQYHGSAYGITPALRGYLRPVGEWNEQEVYIKGDHVRVTLNGYQILDTYLKESDPDHPAANRSKGHFGLAGHNSNVWFRDIRIRELDE